MIMIIVKVAYDYDKRKIAYDNDKRKVAYDNHMRCNMSSFVCVMLCPCHACDLTDLLVAFCKHN
jgi:hypothetical protein